MLVGIRPAALGIILAVMVSLSSTNYVLNGGVSIKAILLGLLSLYLLMKQKWSVPKVIVLSAALGLFL